jgi:surface polysaccharide O-acyltransferase-like enzyme
MKTSTKYFSVALFTFITGYLFLRFAYNAASEIPFAQEVILVVLGTIATIAITAALISKQSEVEIEKEQRVKIFDLKSELYLDLISFIESMILKGKLENKDMLHLEFLTHKISVVANIDVLKEYSEFIDIIKKVSSDEKISPLESDEISIKLSQLCGKIRYDLIQKEDQTDVNIESLITKNIKRF